MEFLIPGYADIVDVIIISIIVYGMLLFIRNFGAYFILGLILTVFLLYFLSLTFNFQMTFFVLQYVNKYWIIVLIVILAPEIRRFLTNTKNLNIFSLSGEKTIEQYHKILRAVSMLSQSRRGGIIVMERSQRLDKFFTSGVEMDALISPKLIYAVLNKNNIIHDGAIIIRGNRILAVKVVLPLSDNVEYSTRYGTRHLATVGITENSDALAILVSEESGKICLGINGELLEDITIEELSQRIYDFNK